MHMIGWNFGMDTPQRFLLLLSLLLLLSPPASEARLLSLSSHQGYSNLLATLGVVCKCCDVEAGGECSSTWTGNCSNLQCSPWKLG